jgi:hypothetical protein
MSYFHGQAIEVAEEQIEMKRQRIGSQSLMELSLLPPSDLTEDTYILKYPFIKLSHSKNVGKFSTLEFMNSEALVKFIDYIYLTIEPHKGYWYGLDGLAMPIEMSDTPLQLSFFECFVKLSKSYFLYKERKKNQRDLERDQPQIKEGRRDENVDEEEIIPTYLEVGEKRELQISDQGSNSSSVEGLILNHEGRLTKGVPNIRVKTVSNGFLRENSYEPFNERTVRSASREKKVRTTAIVGLKDDKSVSLLYFLQ